MIVRVRKVLASKRMKYLVLEKKALIHLVKDNRYKLADNNINNFKSGSKKRYFIRKQIWTNKNRYGDY